MKVSTQLKWWMVWWGLMGMACMLFIIGLSQPHQCPSPSYTRSALKQHLAVHGKVSDGEYITASDSALWSTCERVCDEDVIEMMEEFGAGQ